MEVAKLLVENEDIEIALPNHVGKTPLAVTAMNNREEVIKSIIKGWRDNVFLNLA